MINYTYRGSYACSEQPTKRFHQMIYMRHLQIVPCVSDMPENESSVSLSYIDVLAMVLV